MKLGSIQFLRATAAILVAYIHSLYLQWGFSMHSEVALQQRFFHWRDFGNIGVDLFFVISGFIIYFSAGKYKGIQDGLRFLILRFTRLNPVYYIASLIFLVIFIHSWLKQHNPEFNRDMIVKTILILPLYRSYRVPAIMPVGWTLSFEWYFYLLFFITIISRTRYKGALLLLLILVSVVPGIFLHQSTDYRLDFLTNPMLLEFSLGMLVYWGFTSVKCSKRTAWILLATGLGICLYEIFFNENMNFGLGLEPDRAIVLKRFFCWGIPSALLVTGCVSLEKQGILNRIWHNRLVNRIGDASYSIYLTHVAVYGLFAGLYARVGFFLNPDLAVILQLFTAIFVGIIFYQKVEAPLLHALRRRRS